MRRKALVVSVSDTVITATAIMHRSALADIRPDFYKEVLCRLFVLLDVTSISRVVACVVRDFFQPYI
jgi:hypothetical protein